MQWHQIDKDFRTNGAVLELILNQCDYIQIRRMENIVGAFQSGEIVGVYQPMATH